MDEQTRKLLEECCSGCRMAIESFRQVQEYVKDTGLKQLISTYTEKHCQLEEEAASLLKESGNPEKSPGIMASAMSHFTTDSRIHRTAFRRFGKQRRQQQTAAGCAAQS